MRGTCDDTFTHNHFAFTRFNLKMWLFMRTCGKACTRHVERIRIDFFYRIAVQKVLPFLGKKCLDLGFFGGPIVPDLT